MLLVSIYPIPVKSMTMNVFFEINQFCLFTKPSISILKRNVVRNYVRKF